VHTPGLDALRLKLAGALLLGRVFSIPDITAGALGSEVACCADYPLARASIAVRALRSPR
jgi:hypothetical protein